MAVQQLVIEANKREAGITPAKIRADGLIPAVLYGHNTENISLSVPASIFEKIYREAGESTIVGLKINGSDTVNVLIHDTQAHGTKDYITHVDFYKVNMTEKLTATVPLKFIGEPPAVKALGGTLVHPISEVEVESLPGDLPHEIEVDVSGLVTFDIVIRISDLKVDRSKVEIKAEDDAVVIMVEPPRTEEELKELESAPVEADVTAVEGVAEPKAEEGAEGEGTKEDSEQNKKSAEK